MIQAILRVESNPYLGRKLALRSGQSATVGRTDWADFCVETDEQLADFEFQLNCENANCTLTSCNLLSPILVNGRAVISVSLNDGDTIQAGTTTFRVEIPNQTKDPLSSVASDSNRPAQTESWLANIDLSDKAWELASDATEPLEFVQKLRENEQFTDAINILAHMLSKPDSVIWAANCVRDVNTELVDVDQDALAAAEKWAIEPNESNRRAAENAARNVATECPQSASRWLAMSAFWSDGNIATTDGSVILPDEHLTHQAIKFGLISAATHPQSKFADERLNDFISSALEQIATNAEPLCTA